jgi:hypothetical protein
MAQPSKLYGMRIADSSGDAFRQSRERSQTGLYAVAQNTGEHAAVLQEA